MGGLIDMERKGYESIGCYTCFVSSSFDLDPGFSSRCGLGTFLSWWPPSTMWVGPSICYGHHRGCLNNPIFSNLGVMCCILRAGGCQTCGTHISVTVWWIFSIRSSVELSRLVGVHCQGHMPICPIWACPWSKNFSNLPQIGSRFSGMHISETAGWIYPI